MIPYEQVLATRLPVQEISYTERDVTLYALGVGYGSGPEDELPFVYERDLRVVPTMATVLGFDIGWASAIGVDVLRFVHGQQSLVLHAPLPRRATLVTHSRIVDVFDKGRDKGAVILLETEMREKAGGRLIATKWTSSFARGDGGGGGSGAPMPSPPAPPDRPADIVEVVEVARNQALIFRLSGDSHPLHVDPSFARMAGFPRPVLHGLCTYGIACRLVVARFCRQRPERVRRFEARFAAPVYPGESLRFEMWADGPVVSFRASSMADSARVLDFGHAVLGEPDPDPQAAPSETQV